VGFVMVCPLTIGFTTPLAGDFVDNLLDESFPKMMYKTQMFHDNAIYNMDKIFFRNVFYILFRGRGTRFIGSFYHLYESRISK